MIDGLLPALLGDGPIRSRVETACDDYLQLISLHPHVFFLLVEHPTNEDPLADGKEMVAATISRTLGDVLRGLGVDAAGAEPWAHGLVGLGLSTGEWWLRRKTMSRAAVSAYLSSFIWNAFEGIARENGVQIDSAGRLRLVSGKDADDQRARTSPQERYDGPAHIGDTEVEVRLRGHFQPIDGLFHWWGRIAADVELDRRSPGRRSPCRRRTAKRPAASPTWTRGAGSGSAGPGSPPF